MKDILNQLFEYRSLDRQTAREILRNLAQGQYNPSQVAAFLTVYLMRSITTEELAGFRDAMLDLCVPVEIPEYQAMDVCGTGGDGKNTFNISTLSSFVVAAAGQPVAKHGNYGVSSVCGSSNLLAHFGVKFSSNPDDLRRSLDAANLCFMHAPLFHPAMKNVAGIRRELGVKTFFNMLGPMVNPAFPPIQLTGVFSLELARLYNYLYQQTDRRFVVLHGLDGYDEISLTGPCKAFTNTAEFIYSPEELGYAPISAGLIAGGDTVEEAAQVFMETIGGKGTPARTAVVAANAGMALFCAGRVASPSEGSAIAEETLRSGKALQTFQKFLDITSAYNV